MTNQKKTKIVATLGPSSANVLVLRKMIKAGMNVARINCSHGTHAEYLQLINAVRDAAKREKQNIAVMLDLCGPKIRIGDFSSKTVTLVKGRKFILSSKPVIGDVHKVQISHSNITKEVKAGMRIMLDDGKIELKVTKVGVTEVETVVVVGGEILGRRGVNIPDAALSISAVTPKDVRDIRFGMQQQVDFFALSFVRRAGDVTKLRTILEKSGSRAGIIAKIETQGAVDHIKEVIDAADGVMVARGDLAVEIFREEVPLAQKHIIHLANAAGKSVITATQMLDSMTTNVTPTRAEVGDVANAIFDGTDAVMLSQESAIGDDPVHVVSTMTSIALHTEASGLYHETVMRLRDRATGVVDSVSLAVARSAQESGAVAIVAFSESGFTPHMVARHKPQVPVLTLTTNTTTYHQLALSYGVTATITSHVREIGTAIRLAKKELLRHKLANKGDVFILVLGIPFGLQGGTNTMIVQIV